MAGLLAPGSRFRRCLANALIAGPALLLAWFIIWQFDKPPPPETIAPKQLRVEERQQEVAQRERTKNLCQQQAVCRKFGEARQACATAGNYKNCVDIKMGSDAKDLYPCMNDGTVWATPKDMPDQLT